MAYDSKLGRLPLKRIAVTLPPEGWFHGIARALFHVYRQALVDLGMEVFDVPVDAFLPPDAVRIAQLTAELRAFRPDLAMGLSHGSYALICRLPARRDGWRPNFFTEILDVPTVCLWDHAPVELADQLLRPEPPNPAASSPGAWEMLRRTLTHPRLMHWSRDSGQTQIMQDLGFAFPDRMIHEATPTLPGFLPRETSEVHTDAAPGVGFVGHFYQQPTNYPDPGLAALADEMVQTWIGTSEPSLWNVLARRIAAMEPDMRQKLALDPDQTRFWRFAHWLIVHQAQTSSRLSLLGAAGVPVACYGNLKANEAGVPGNLVPVPSQVPFGPQLAAMLARHPITIDVLNPGFVHGYSHKPILGFSAGGFMLMNRKQDFVDAFGQAGEAVSYRDGADLFTKIDLFLTRPKYRREVGDAIRETIAARFQLNDVLSRVLLAASQYVDNRESNVIPAIPSVDGSHVTTAMNLLPSLRSEPHWPGASVRHRKGQALVIAPKEWGYAAAIRIPRSVKAMKEPHLRLSLIVETGRIGIAASSDDTGTLLEEQLVSASADPVGITVELPYEGVSAVILRNTAVIPSRARVLEASLCDRTCCPA